MVFLRYLIEISGIDVSNIPAGTFTEIEPLVDGIIFLIVGVLIFILVYFSLYSVKLIKYLKKMYKKGLDKKDRENGSNSAEFGIGKDDLEQIVRKNNDLLMEFMEEVRKKFDKYDRQIEFLKTQLILNKNLKIKLPENGDEDK